jgi:hypothetical protein
MQPTITLFALAGPALRWGRARLASSHALRVLAPLTKVLADTCRLPMPVPIPLPRRRPSWSGIAALGLALAIVAPLPAAARPGTQFESVADGRLVDVQVRVEGRDQPLYFAPGRFDRRYFQAFRGRNYSLVMRNNTGRRVGVLIAVDGLNVVTGQRSSLSRHESMYVLDPHEEAVIRGWRTSLRDIRKFVFVDEERSYAERTDQANGDLGWIRVLAFREQLTWWRDGLGKVREQTDRDERPYGAVPEIEQAPGAPNGVDGSRKSAPNTTEDSRMRAERFDNGPESNPGTGWGERGSDPVRRTTFVAEAHATDHIVLRYEYAKGLRALGITPWQGRDRLWDRERGELGFAQPPRW